MFANAAGIVTRLIIGLTFSPIGSFAYALMFVGAVTIVGALSYISIVGDIRRIELSEFNLKGNR